MMKFDPKALHDFLVRLSKREKLILYITISFISLMLVDRLVIAPIAGRLTRLDTDIRETEARLKKYSRIVAQKDRIIAERKKYDSFLSSNGLSDETQMTNILKEIENLANKSSVYLIDMKPGGIKTMDGSKKYIVNLSCEAQIDQLSEFIFDIENSIQLLTIDKYQMEPKTKESSIARCSMSISKISM